MAPVVIGEIYYDKKYPINKGVQAFQIIGCASGVMMHRVVYKCPISGDSYTFVTSLRNIQPGLIAYLYRTSWKIEKIFDQVKNKLSEKKAWATSDIANEMQAQFVCMVYNLMLLLEDCVEKEGITNDIEDIRRSKRLKEVLVDTSLARIHCQTSSHNPKGLRNHLFMNTSWREALGPLQRINATF